MAIVRGVVEKLFEKQGKFGLQVSAKVEETWYDVGKTKSGLQEGDFVEFQATQNERGFWRIEKGSIKAVDAPADVSKPVGKSVASTGKGQTFSNDGRQDSIVYQSSRKDALALVSLLFTAGVIDLGKSKNMADKQGIIETYVDKYTEHFIDEVKANKPHPMQAESDTAALPGTKGKSRPIAEDDDDDLDAAFAA